MVVHVEALKWCGSVQSGGSQPQFVRCSDNCIYVTKAPNNPHGVHGLANELLASMILERLGIPTPRPAIVQVNPSMVSLASELPSDCAGHLEAWQSGKCFGSRLDLYGWRSVDRLPVLCSIEEHQIGQIRNLSAFHDVLVFDLWAMQTDKRQAVFVRPKGAAGYDAVMIDNDFCFGGPGWKPIRNLRYVLFPQTGVYRLVYGMDAFESIIRRFRRKLRPSALREIAAEIPLEWIHDRAGFDNLIERLIQRLGCLEELLQELHEQKPSPFVNWLKMPKYPLRDALKSLTPYSNDRIPPMYFEQEIDQEGVAN